MWLFVVGEVVHIKANDGPRLFTAKSYQGGFADFLEFLVVFLVVLT